MRCTCSMHGVLKPHGKRRLGKPICRWEYNIKRNLKNIVYEAEDWVHLPQGKVQWRTFLNTGINVWSSTNDREFLDLL